MSKENGRFERKYVFEQVQEIFKQNNCELLETTYTTTNNPLRYRCECGTESKILLPTLIKGGRCRKCGAKKIKAKKTLPFETVKSVFDKANYTLLSTEYHNAHEKLSCVCPKGHELSIAYCNFNSGCRCRYCFFDSCKKPKPPLLRPTPLKHTYESVKLHLETEGYTLLETRYITSHTPMNCICNKGHTTKIRYSGFRLGVRCIYCGHESRTGPNNVRWESDRVELKKNQKYSQVCRTMVRRTLRAINQDKIRKTESYLGYTSKELKDHFENHPNMKSIGTQKWVPDHIFPVAAFVKLGITDLSLINSLDNLQPLTESDNHKKSDKYDPIEFEDFLSSKKVFYV